MALKPKVFIGALGGSGTRALAKLLIELNYFIGDDLNSPKDNLIFSRLFKNPKWYCKARENDIYERIRIFNNYMTNDIFNPVELIKYFRFTRDNNTFISDNSHYKFIAKKYFNKKHVNKTWAFKEPNSLIYYDYFMNYFPEIKYIHVLRNGLDMAFSNNKNQLYNWGWLYNIEISKNETEESLAKKQLKYWVETTKDIKNKSEKFPHRTLFVNHSNLLKKPINEIDKILTFLDINEIENVKNRLYNIPKDNGSLNRFRENDLSIFDKDDVNYVQKNGFSTVK